MCKRETAPYRFELEQKETCVDWAWLRDSFFLYNKTNKYLVTIATELRVFIGRCCVYTLDYKTTIYIKFFN